MATKKQARARAAKWRLALAEGRIVRSNGGLTLTEHPTVQAAQDAVFAHRRVGLIAEIVSPPKEEPST